MKPKTTFAIKLAFATIGLVAVIALAWTGHATTDQITDYVKWVSVALIGGTAIVGAANANAGPTLTINSAPTKETP